jgi:hypothetical protein
MIGPPLSRGERYTSVERGATKKPGISAAFSLSFAHSKRLS